MTLGIVTDGRFELALRLATVVAVSLLVSGFIHLSFLVVLGGSWSGPVSLRKPALFGISGGLTVLSLAWVFTKVRPRKRDSLLLNCLSASLLVEVGIITAQYWRGVASHFNHSTGLDTAIEITMLILILFATLAIVYLTVRSFAQLPVDPAMALAIRGGMVLLTLSCVLGILTSVLGEVSLSAGKSYELWGKAGVLKFPHGAALHAIQLLPFVAWLLQILRTHNSLFVMQMTLLSQILFLVYAVVQTFTGRDRFEWGPIGGVLLMLTIVSSVFPAIALIRGFGRYVRRTG
jgi:hypothetical protein